MKRIVIFSLVAVFLHSCKPAQVTKTKQQIAEQNIKEYLLLNLDDTSSYEPVSFQKLKIDSGVSETFYTIDTGDVISPPDKSFKGYYMVHKFRAKNKFNAIVLNSNIFFMDSTLVIKHVE